jgi:beta-lactamase superfamily II metal-dependent hydrolase
MVSVHFLNVGHGDCTIIEHASGHITMVDINNSDALDDDTRRELAQAFGITGATYAAKQAVAEALGQSFRKLYLTEAGYNIGLTDPVTYYKARWGGDAIFRFAVTHPHLDHMRGVVRLRQEGIEMVNFWDTYNSESEPDFKNDTDEAEWNEYQRLRKATGWPKVLRLFRNATGKYYNEDDGGGPGDGLYVLAPTRELCVAANEAGDPNGHSYVLMLIHQGIRVVLGGDATEAVWQSIYDCYGNNLKCHVLKASHHGRDSGYHAEAVAAMKPEYTIVSVGKKPETDASNNYGYHTTKGVWSTRWHGNIVVTIQDNGSYSIDSDKMRRDRESADRVAVLPGASNPRLF